MTRMGPTFSHHATIGHLLGGWVGSDEHVGKSIEAINHSLRRVSDAYANHMDNLEDDDDPNSPSLRSLQSAVRSHTGLFLPTAGSPTPPPVLLGDKAVGIARVNHAEKTIGGEPEGGKLAFRGPAVDISRTMPNAEQPHQWLHALHGHIQQSGDEIGHALAVGLHVVDTPGGGKRAYVRADGGRFDTGVSSAVMPSKAVDQYMRAYQDVRSGVSIPKGSEHALAFLSRAAGYDDDDIMPNWYRHYTNGSGSSAAHENIRSAMRAYASQTVLDALKPEGRVVPHTTDLVRNRLNISTGGHPRSGRTRRLTMAPGEFWTPDGPVSSTVTHGDDQPNIRSNNKRFQRSLLNDFYGK